MIELSELTAISPIDGRYRNKCEELAPYLSEFGLMKYRVWIEVEYFIFLSEKVLGKDDLKIVSAKFETLRNRITAFSVSEALKIKEIESVTNHDVKAVEYFVKDILEQEGLSNFREWVHFGLTSQDINNTGIPLSWKHSLELIYFPLMENLIAQINRLADTWQDISMLARTHGQPASPTTLGKEFKVFEVRLIAQFKEMKIIPHQAKFGGATGNLNAHYVAFPETDWHKFADNFVAHFGLHRSFPTTQIEHYDYLAAQLDAMKRINNILVDMCRDIWSYVSMEYFKQQLKSVEIGSSAMPHKVNPIDFENAEGNLGMANAIFEFMSGKLPVSRLQRDLTDSTVLRNLGVPMSHTIIALKSITKGLSRLMLNSSKIDEDLDANWAVLAEAIQTILRRENYDKPYEALKQLTRTNQTITKETLHDFINTLKINDQVKDELKKLTPNNYTGKAY
jgi:adenylosuccinate lyase